MIRFFDYLAAIRFTPAEYDRLSFRWRYIIYQMYIKQLMEALKH